MVIFNRYLAKYGNHHYYHRFFGIFHSRSAICSSVEPEPDHAALDTVCSTACTKKLAHHTRLPVLLLR